MFPLGRVSGDRGGANEKSFRLLTVPATRDRFSRDRFPVPSKIASTGFQEDSLMGFPYQRLQGFLVGLDAITAI